ncbi:helix-turn-helix transcriptional regulator [Pacificispira sp.]|uniref:helix-turn-helix transcriptional regulator n=1 Tax=Pacificispira sp. TaxID=2888761 RepID=UPI003BA9818B
METNLLSTEEAAGELGFSAHTLENWRCLNKGPKFIRFGRQIRYRRRDLERWINIHAVATSESQH